MELILSSLQGVLTPYNFIAMAAGMAVGIIFGATPGLNANIAIVLCLPFTYGMEAIPAMLLLLSIFCGASFGGSITAILIGTPGTNNAAMTAIDGYPLGKKGQPYRGIMIALVASTVGGIISALVLLIAAPFVSRVTIKFAPPELCMVSVFGLSVMAAISGKNFWKGLLSGCFGILISLVGLDTMTGQSRFIFGNYNLMSGFSLASVLLGMFAMFIIMEKIEDIYCHSREVIEGEVKKKKDDKLTIKDVIRCMPTMIRSSAIGVVIGAIPGIGGGVASILCYDTAKRTSKYPEEFGHGSIEGIAAPEAGNNAVTGSALIPTLTLGVPGAPAAATLMGAFMIHGLTPGPLLFSENAGTMYAILSGLVIANLLMFVVGYLMSSSFVHITKVPLEILVPALAMTCIAGAYSERNSLMTVYILLIFGLVATVFSWLKIPNIPMVLGFILGPLVESNLRKALVMSGGELSIFIRRPICVFFLILTLVFLAALKVDIKSIFKKIIKKNH